MIEDYNEEHYLETKQINKEVQGTINTHTQNCIDLNWSVKTKWTSNKFKDKAELFSLLCEK